MPSISQLQYILAVHKLGHFGRAAAEVGVAQPTLSSQIHRAEEELGVTFFDRHTKPIELTEQGAQLIELARAVVSSHEQLLAVASGEFTEPSGSFTLGVIPTLASYVLPWFLRSFAERYPRVELSVHERPTDDILVELRANRMDAGILATPLSEPALRERILFYDPFYLYANADEPILARDALDVTDIDSSRLWLLEDGHCFRAQVINLCGLDERQLLSSVKFAAGSFETLRHLIDSCGGYTLVPETYARTLPRSTRQRVIRPFSGDVPTREVSLVYHQQSWKAAIHEALAQEIARTKPGYLEAELAEGEVLPIRVK